MLLWPRPHSLPRQKSRSKSLVRWDFTPDPIRIVDGPVISRHPLHGHSHHVGGRVGDCAATAGKGRTVLGEL